MSWLIQFREKQAVPDDQACRRRLSRYGFQLIMDEMFLDAHMIVNLHRVCSIISYCSCVSCARGPLDVRRTSPLISPRSASDASDFTADSPLFLRDITYIG